MKQFKVLFARFPFGNQEVPDVTDWMIETVIKAKADARISEVRHMRLNDTPITMTRNKVIKAAQQDGADFVVMIDSDMKPDLAIPGAKPFWPTAFDFAVQHRGPCVVGVPYCGPPPHENVYVFRWAHVQDGHPNADLRIDQYPREDAAARAGFEEVAALPTGLILIDMRAIASLKPPYFEYEYQDPPFNTVKATTEDVYFTRNLSLAGVPQYVLWDAWAGHHKRKVVGKPTILSCEAVREQFRGAILRGSVSNEVLINVGEGQDYLPPILKPAEIKNACDSPLSTMEKYWDEAGCN